MEKSIYDETIEDLILSDRGRGNIISVCYDYKFDIDKKEHEEDYEGVISQMTKNLPEKFRKTYFHRNFRKNDGNIDEYIIKKGREFLLKINPSFKRRRKCEIFHETHMAVQEGPQQDEKLEQERKELAFLYSIRAFLRHI
ncbi:MAG: hypothetical protein PHH54_04730 [Candidatus Nanoarchaeia archaeon]|nr:hypothetical protein [Candidatus Nanoarchaeia archaeon]MDD5741262.1 hypothetical protein [Candidatus Nanoarchaeia archaeon]